MMAGTILLYGFDELPEILAVQAAAGPFQAEVKPIWRDQWRTPVGALAGRKLRPGKAEAVPARLNGQMLVLCDLDEQVDALLPALRGAGIGTACYKAVLTAYNQEWDGVALLAELQKERRAIEDQRRKG